MSLGLEAALLLRAKGGVNFLLHSQGIGARIANEATREAVSIIEQYAASQSNSSTDSSGDQPPGYQAGQLVVCDGRLIVLYRLVHGIWLMTIAPICTNFLLCGQLMNCAVRLLVAVCKGLDITPDKIARRFPEAFLALGQLLGPGGLGSDPDRLLAAAEAEVNAISPEFGGKPKGPTGSIKSRLGVGLSKKAMLPSTSVSSLNSAVSVDISTYGERSLAEDCEYTGSSAFTFDAAAMEAAQALSQFSEPLQPLPEVSKHAQESLDEFFGPAIPVHGAEFLAGTGLETLEAPASNYDTNFVIFAALQHSAVLEKSDMLWAEFETKGRSIPTAGGPAPTEIIAAAKPSLPLATAKQHRAVVNGNALQLVELWKAVFIGSRLEAAGTFGEVLSTGAVPKCAATAAFKIGSPQSAPPALAAAVKAMRGQCQVTELLEKSCFQAIFAELQNVEAPFLQYQLPAMAVSPPVLMVVSSDLILSARQRSRSAGSSAQVDAADITEALTALPISGTENIELKQESQHSPEIAEEAQCSSDWRLVVQIIVSTEICGPLRGVCIDLDVGPAFGNLLTASPGAKWSFLQRRVRWQPYHMAPGTRYTLQALFRPPEQLSQKARQQAKFQAKASLHAFGPAGQGLSGLTLLSGSSTESLKDSRRACHCEVYAKLDCSRKQCSLARKDILEKAVTILEKQKWRNSNAGKESAGQFQKDHQG